MSNHIVVLDGVVGKIPNFKINSGSDADMNYILAMRSNLVQYASVFNDWVLSLSDEAFLLVVLIN
jgi:hypothetical protein